MVGDPVGDFIVRITNAGAVRKEVVSAPYSKLKDAVAETLVRAGYLTSTRVRGKKARKVLECSLAYGVDGTHRVGGVQRVSKPGRRVYAAASDIHPIKFGRGTLVLSTPEGVLTGEEARKRNVGGEQLFIIW